MAYADLEKLRKYRESYYEKHKEEYRLRKEKWNRDNPGRSLRNLRRWLERIKSDPALHLERIKKIKKYDKERLTIRLALLRKLKDKPCADCGLEYPYYVMQFDHVPERGPKLFQLSATSAKKSLDLIILESKKCDVVCANCHSSRTWKRLVKNRKEC